MSRYRHDEDFFRDTAHLIDEGATLRDLYDTMLTVPGCDLGAVDASSKRLRQLAEMWRQLPAMVPVRLHELFSGLTVEHSDDYVLAVIGALGGRYQQEIRLFMLRHDHALRDEVFWRIFEVEGTGEISLTNIDKFSPAELNWHTTVVTLTDEGTLDRARVLRSCLEALNRDFSAYRAGWFSRVYTALDPDPAEAAVDQALLRLCLTSPVTATLSLGMKQLAAVHRAGLLDTDAFVESSAPVLLGPKAAALRCVRVLTSIKDGNDANANALALGLGHQHADVQRAAIKALTALGRDDLVHRQRDSLSPAVAAELPFLDGVAAPATSADPDDGAGSAVAPPEPLVPWTDEDAAERFALLFENPWSALEFELALAWLATTERAAEVLAPFVRRARQVDRYSNQFWLAALVLAAAEPESPFLSRPFFQPMMGQLINGRWIEHVGEPIPQPTIEESTPLPSFVRRLREVAAVLQGDVPRRPLLATPTDSDGWIDAGTVLERFRQAAGLRPLTVDLTQAILRVRPADRARVVAATGATPPVITESFRIHWAHHSGSWWYPRVHGDPDGSATVLEPALIATGGRTAEGSRFMPWLFAEELTLVDPSSTLPLAAAGLNVMADAAKTKTELGAVAVLAALAAHPGRWTAETAQLVALGMAATRADQRSPAAELFAAAFPHRLDIASAASGFAACAPVVVLSRWAKSFADAATLAPGAVIDLLTAMLPALDPKARGIGSLLTVLLDESLRLARPVDDAALRSWLARFAGASATAKAAKALLARR